jgi:hypothetical protein
MSALCWGSRGVVGGGGGGPGDATVWPDVATTADLQTTDLRTGDIQRVSSPPSVWQRFTGTWRMVERSATALLSEPPLSSFRDTGNAGSTGRQAIP